MGRKYVFFGPKKSGSTVGGVVKRREAEARQREEAERKRLAQLEEAKRIERSRLLQKETAAKEQLAERTFEVEDAIDAELKALTSEVEYNKGEAQKIVSGQISERGLLRSSFGQGQRQEVSQRALRQELGLQSRALQQKLAVSETVRQTLNKLADQRADLESRISQASYITELNIAEGFDIQRIKSDFETHVTKLDIDAKNQAAIIGGVSSLLADLTTIGIAGSVSGQ